MEEKTEVRTWGIAAIILVLIAISAFSIQRLVRPFFDIVQEICIFYVPAAASVAFFLYFRNRPRPASSS